MLRIKTLYILRKLKLELLGLIKHDFLHILVVMIVNDLFVLIDILTEALILRKLIVCLSRKRLVLE